MIWLLLLVTAVLLLAAVPIFVALGLGPAVIMLLQDVPITTLGQRMFGGLDRFSLMAMPFFILAANLMSGGGISPRIVKLADSMMGRFYGGAALTNTLACLFFGALSGSSPATVVAIGGMTKPMMDDRGYDKNFSIGLIMASSSVAILIPPSITMIIYAAVTNVSVGELFLAGVGPGLTMGLIFMAYSYYYARKKGLRLKPGENPNKFGSSLRGSVWALGVPAIIIGGIYGGIVTPTEAAVVSCVYAMLVGWLIYRELNLTTLYKVVRDSMMASAQVMILVAGATVLSWMLTMQQVQPLLEDVISFAQGNTVLILLILDILLLITGMFLDPSAIILILGPLFVPILTKVGIDPVHLGAIMVTGCALGMYSPPFGLNLFISKALWKFDFSVLARAGLFWLALSIPGLLLITYLPWISMWLPRLMYGN